MKYQKIYLHATLKLKGSNDYRLRVGDYRIIFIFDRDIIKILKIGHRKNIYD